MAGEYQNIMIPESDESDSQDEIYEESQKLAEARSTQTQEKLAESTAANHFMDIIRAAPDIAPAINTEPADDVNETLATSLDGMEVPWHSEFHPSSNVAEEIPLNPPLSDIDIGMGSSGFSVYVNYLSSYKNLINKLLGDELTNSKVLVGCGLTTLQRLCTHVLLPMDTRIIHCIIRGDLSHQYRTDSKIKTIMNKLWKSQTPPIGNKYRQVQPSVYIQYLVDKNGLGLAAEQLQTLVACLRDYCDVENGNKTLAFDVDSGRQPTKWQEKWSNGGKRLYLNRTKNQAPDQRRCDWVETFCVALESHISRHPNNAETFPLREVGYSIRSQHLLQEHRCRVRSNFLMNLIDAIGDIKFPRKFHLDQYIIARFFGPVQGHIGETLYKDLKVIFNLDTVLLRLNVVIRTLLLHTLLQPI